MSGTYPSARPDAGLSTRVRAAAGLFVVNTVLLFFPPIPPIVKGSLWSYGLKTGVVVLLVLEAYRRAEELTDHWAGRQAVERWTLAITPAMGLLAVALWIRASAPDLSIRFSAEVGPWETISTACYACGCVLLWRVAGRADPGIRRHLRLVAGAFAVLLLEEVDYGGVFGGLIGRVDGVYVGSLHDLLNLAIHGGLQPVALVSLSAAAALAVAALWWRGYLDARLLARTVASSQGVWLALGLLFLVLAGVGEAGLFGSVFTDPSPEEALEMTGAIFLGAFALGMSTWGGRAAPEGDRNVPEREVQRAS